MRNLLPLSILATVIATPVAAQGDINGRVGRLESEMRAVQRKIFPGGAGQVVLPDIVAPVTEPTAAGAPAASAVIDLGARVTSLEQQMSAMTGQIEQTGFQLRTLREQFEAYRRSTDARLTTAASTPPATPVTEGAPSDDPPRATAARPASEPPIRTAAAEPRPAAVIARPASGDPAEDSYLYGYRLWEAKRYAEAQSALKRTVADFPKSRRASYAQNLLGRAYLDDGKPSLASMAFYDNYKKMPDGERAPDSLLYLGQALVKLNKPADACKVYDELVDVYGAKMSAGMKADVTRGRAVAKCK